MQSKNPIQTEYPSQTVLDRRPERHVAISRITLVIVIMSVLAAACGSASADSTSSAAEGNPTHAETHAGRTEPNPAEAGQAAASQAEEDQAAATGAPAARAAGSPVSARGCEALVQFIEQVAAFDSTSFEDPSALREGFELTHDRLTAVQADPPTAAIADEIDTVAEAWVPWKELFEEADYVFMDVDPVKMQELLSEQELLADPDEFMRRSATIFRYAVDECGVDPDLVDDVVGSGDVGVEASRGDVPDVLIDTGAAVAFDFEGTRYEMTDGFCGVAPDGLLVGRFTDGTMEASFLGDTTGEQEHSNVFTLAGDGSAQGTQVEWSFNADGTEGTFESGRVAGSFRCE